jgi:hypothetical protein
MRDAPVTLSDQLLTNSGKTMNLTCFDDLLSLARKQPEPQRLLFAAAAGIRTPHQPSGPFRGG